MDSSLYSYCGLWHFAARCFLSVCEAFWTALQYSVSSSSLTACSSLLFVKAFFGRWKSLFFPSCALGFMWKHQTRFNYFISPHTVEFISIFIMCVLFICWILWLPYRDHFRSVSSVTLTAVWGFASKINDEQFPLNEGKKWVSKIGFVCNKVWKMSSQYNCLQPCAMMYLSHSRATS